MAGVPLSNATRLRIEMLFDNDDQQVATDLLINECGSDLPFCHDNGPFECERVRFAALKLSDGRIERLRNAIQLAKTDWRDLLMGAGFGNDVSAHKRWMPIAPRRMTQFPGTNEEKP